MVKKRDTTRKGNQAAGLHISREGMLSRQLGDDTEALPKSPGGVCAQGTILRTCGPA